MTNPTTPTGTAPIDLDVIARALFRAFDDTNIGREPLHDFDVMAECDFNGRPVIEGWRAAAKVAIDMGAGSDHAAMVAELRAARAEVFRLTACLATANANHEDFERRWYLATDERDAARARVGELEARERALVAGLAEMLATIDRSQRDDAPAAVRSDTLARWRSLAAPPDGGERPDVRALIEAYGLASSTYARWSEAWIHRDASATDIVLDESRSARDATELALLAALGLAPPNGGG